MSKFDDLVSELTRVVNRIGDQADRDVAVSTLSAIVNEHTRETLVRDEEVRELNAKLAVAKTDLDKLQSRKSRSMDGTSPTRTRVTRAASRLPINLEPDLERIIELAHANAPKETERLLSYMGLSLVAGTLRDHAAVRHTGVTAAGAGVPGQQGLLFSGDA